MTWLVLAALWACLWAPFFWCCCTDRVTYPAPGCACNPIPTPLYLASSNTTQTPNATLVYQARPADLAVGPDPWWYSESLTDPFTGNSMYFTIRCVTGIIYIDSTSSHSIHFQEIAYAVGGANTCNPFAMVSGTASGTTATVTVTE